MSFILSSVTGILFFCFTFKIDAVKEALSLTSLSFIPFHPIRENPSHFINNLSSSCFSPSVFFFPFFSFPHISASLFAITNPARISAKCSPPPRGGRSCSLDRFSHLFWALAVPGLCPRSCPRGRVIVRKQGQGEEVRL